MTGKTGKKTGKMEGGLLEKVGNFRTGLRGDKGRPTAVERDDGGGKKKKSFWSGESSPGEANTKRDEALETRAMKLGRKGVLW